MKILSLAIAARYDKLPVGICQLLTCSPSAPEVLDRIVGRPADAPAGDDRDHEVGNQDHRRGEHHSVLQSRMIAFGDDVQQGRTADRSANLSGSGRILAWIYGLVS